MPNNGYCTVWQPGCYTVRRVDKHPKKRQSMKKERGKRITAVLEPLLELNNAIKYYIQLLLQNILVKARPLNEPLRLFPTRDRKHLSTIPFYSSRKICCPVSVANSFPTTRQPIPDVLPLSCYSYQILSFLWLYYMKKRYLPQVCEYADKLKKPFEKGYSSLKGS